MSLLRALRRNVGLRPDVNASICHPELLKCFDLPSRANSLDPFPVSMEEAVDERTSGDKLYCPAPTPKITPLPPKRKDSFATSPMQISPIGTPPPTAHYEPIDLT